MKRLQDKKKPKTKQNTFRTAERVRVAKYRKLKKERELHHLLLELLISRPLEQSNQLVKHLNVQQNHYIPKSPRKKMFVLAKMASEAGLEITGFTGKKRSCSNKVLSDQACEIVKDFYLENEISWQAPGRKDRAIHREVVNEKNTKETKQIRYLLMSLKEAYEHFENKNPNVSIGLSKFCFLRPFHVYVCKYHENIRLILIALEKYIDISSDFSGFVD